MSKEQIEEMAVDLCLIDRCKHLPKEECHMTTCAHCEAEALYKAGYRKQRYGEWKLGESGYIYFCSCCGHTVLAREEEDWNFCPHCGAKMKGGEE
ncbi:MAG: hypothetical protein IJX46_07770 [Clostridia bacterium]|nr:hypothetical protein [Clostridia bacterium]